MKKKKSKPIEGMLYSQDVEAILIKHLEDQNPGYKVEVCFSYMFEPCYHDLTDQCGCGTRFEGYSYKLKKIEDN